MHTSSGLWRRAVKPTVENTDQLEDTLYGALVRYYTPQVFSTQLPYSNTLQEALIDRLTEIARSHYHHHVATVPVTGYEDSPGRVCRYGRHTIELVGVQRISC